MRKLAVTNQKGGAGKSTVSLHIANMAKEHKVRTLVVDVDPQASLSQSFPSKEGAGPGLMASDLFSDETSELVPEVVEEGVAIIRGDRNLRMISGDQPGVVKRLASQLRRFEKDYDLCVIDTPGAIDFNPPMTAAALVAADAVVCPFSVGLYEGKALADLWEFLKVIKTTAYNPGLRLMGLLPSRINTRSKDEMEALESLREQFGDAMIPGMLAERAAVKKAVMLGKPVWQGVRGAGHKAAAQEWRTICNYILGDLGKVTQ